MKTLDDEIKDAFTQINVGQSLTLESLSKKTPGLVMMDSYDSILVAIPCDPELTFDEEFAGMGMRTCIRKIDGDELSLLTLVSSEYSSRNEFATICAVFLSPDNRSLVSKNPSDWWERWKHLLGNRQGEKNPYPVIGELFTWAKLLDAGVNAKWTGPTGSTHDIVASKRSFEVKSTTDRTGSVVTISNQHQLSVSPNRELYLVVNRFEANAGDISINKLVCDLIRLGAEKTYIETQLTKLGFTKGRTGRSKTYRLLESVVYHVNETFPKVVAESFKGDVFPCGIDKITYDINLGNMPHSSLENFLK